MAITTDSVRQQLEWERQNLLVEAEYAHKHMDTNALRALKHKMMQLEEKTRSLDRYKMGFGAAAIKEEGSKVWWDEMQHKPYQLSQAQAQAMKQAAEEKARIQAEHEALRRKNLLAEPHNACSLSAAVNLWVVKFGDGWVRVNDIPDEGGNLDTGEMNWHGLMRRLDLQDKIEKLEDYVRIIT